MGLQNEPKVTVAADKVLALVALLTLSMVKLANKARAPFRCLTLSMVKLQSTLEKSVKWHYLCSVYCLVVHGYGNGEAPLYGNSRYANNKVT